MVLDDGNFKICLTGQRTNTGRTCQLLHVGLLRGHLQHAADPAAIFHGDTRLEQLHILNGIGIERCEQSEEMRRVIDRAAIEQYEVLVGGTTSHVIAARSLSDGGDARQREHNLHDVRLTEGRRNILQDLGLKLLSTDHHVFHGRLPTTDNDDLVQFLIIGNACLRFLHARHYIGLCL